MTSSSLQRTLLTMKITKVKVFLVALCYPAAVNIMVTSTIRQECPPSLRPPISIQDSAWRNKKGLSVPTLEAKGDRTANQL